MPTVTRRVRHAHVRVGDPVDEGVVFRREIPLWGLITLCGTIVAAVFGVGLALWIQMQAVLQEQRTQASNQNRTTQQLDTVLASLNTASTKDREHDLLIANLTARMTTLETAFPRQLLNASPSTK